MSHYHCDMWCYFAARILTQNGFDVYNLSGGSRFTDGLLLDGYISYLILKEHRINECTVDVMK